MKLSAQRGAIAITLDRPRFIFFDLAATWLLVDHYGLNFASALYNLEKKGENTELKLRSKEALCFFLWAGLQTELQDSGETLTLDDVSKFITPWTIREIFNSLVLALTGAVSTPEAPALGKAGAVSPAVKRAAKKTTAKKVSTLKLRSGLRTVR